MARQFVILALVFFAVVEMACGAATSIAPVPSNMAPVVSPPSSSTIGAISGTAGEEAAPIGSPVSSNAFPNLASAPAPSAASALQISTFAGVVATAFAGFFF